MTTESTAAELNARSFTFRDRTGREWDVTITLRGALRMDKGDYSTLFKGPVSFCEPSRELLYALYSDTRLLGAVIWNLISSQAEQVRINEDQFSDGLDGPTIEAAKTAFRGALRHFFPQMANGLSQLEAILAEKQAKLTAELDQRMSKVGERLDVELQTVLKQLDAELSTASSTSSPTAA